MSFPNEEAVRLVMSRSVLIRTACELWAASTTIDGLHQKMKGLNSELIKAHFGAEKSFKIMVEAFNKTLTQPEKVDKIESFSYLPIEGPISLKNPEVTYYYYEYWGLDPGRLPLQPLNYFFGRWICESQRQYVSKYSLKERHFIGNTSMDPHLSMIMANMAQIQDGHLILDPFVGSGSLLISAAHFGGYVLGAEIDWLVLHGKSKPTRANQRQRQPDEHIKKNMKQYRLSHRYIDVALCDASTPVWKPQCRFDAIITDPPYGIRESTNRVGAKPNKTTPIPDHIPEGHHFPTKMQYALGDIYKDLLNFAANHLTLHGRLVFWIPIVRSEYNVENLPKHPCLRLMFNSEQGLTANTSRRLITMEKVMEPDQAVCESAFADQLHNTFREKYFLGSAEVDPIRDDFVKPTSRRSKRGQGLRGPDL